MYALRREQSNITTRGLSCTKRLLSLQVLQQLLQLGVVREANVWEGTLCTLHEETAQCPSRHTHASIGEQRTQGSVQAPGDTTVLVLSLTSVGREEVTWAGDQ